MTWPPVPLCSKGAPHLYDDRGVCKDCGAEEPTQPQTFIFSREVYSKLNNTYKLLEATETLQRIHTKLKRDFPRARIVVSLEYDGDMVQFRFWHMQGTPDYRRFSYSVSDEAILQHRDPDSIAEDIIKIAIKEFN